MQCQTILKKIKIIFGDLVFTESPVTIDEPLLKEVADLTNGRYFRATSNTSLQQVYNEINQLEKTELKTNTLFNYDEYFRLFLWIAIATLLIDAILRWLLYKTIL